MIGYAVKPDGQCKLRLVDAVEVRHAYISQVSQLVPMAEDNLQPGPARRERNTAIR